MTNDKAKKIIQKLKELKKAVEPRAPGQMSLF